MYGEGDYWIRWWQLDPAAAAVESVRGSMWREKKGSGCSVLFLHSKFYEFRSPWSSGTSLASRSSRAKRAAALEAALVAAALKSAPARSLTSVCALVPSRKHTRTAAAAIFYLLSPADPCDGLQLFCKTLKIVGLLLLRPSLYTPNTPRKKHTQQHGRPGKLKILPCVLLVLRAEGH
jgi:hypothetical protein